MTEYSDNLLKFFTTKQISIFNNKEELLNNIKKILNNSKLRNKMVISSSKQSKNFSYSSIIKEIIKKIQKTKIKKSNKIQFNELKNLSRFELFILQVYKLLSISFLKIFFDSKKSFKISRRVLFEIEWRIRKENTYSKTGWCFNLFNII